MKKLVLLSVVVLFLFACSFNLIDEPKCNSGMQSDGSIIGVVRVSPKGDSIENYMAWDKSRKEALEELRLETGDPNLRLEDLEKINVDIKVTKEGNFYYAEISAEEVKRWRSFHE